MRTIKELLELLKKELPNRLGRSDGICTVVRSLFLIGKIDLLEYSALDDYLESKFKGMIPFDEDYIWPHGVLKEREEWVNKLINECEQETNC
jgi:hypothetical protein